MTNGITGYSRAQIILHWAIAALILVQFLGHDAIIALGEATEKGLPVSQGTKVFALAHVWLGVVILALSLWRIFLRLTRGAPAAPANEAAHLRFLAKAAHVILYAALLLMPLSGIGSWFFGAEQAGDAHAVLKVVILVTVGLHILGALYHRLILKSGVMERMLHSQAE